jgi:CxxC motif-containing protein
VTEYGEFICVVCPNGCFIETEYKKDGKGAPKLLSIKGNCCSRGGTWVIQELRNPMRTISTSVPVDNGDFLLASVRTANPIPLAKVRAVMDELRGKRLSAPLHIGDVIAKRPAGVDTEIIVSREVHLTDKGMG